MVAVQPLHAMHIAGPRDRAPVVFLHGFLGTAADWTEVMAALAGSCACWALDLPGHGASLGRPAADYAMAGAARAVLATLDSHRIDRATLVGYSMGGRLALQLAIQAPDRWNGVVLESCSPGLADERERAGRRAIDEDWAVRLEEEPLPAVLRAWYRQPLFASLQRDPERLDRLLAARAGAAPRELACALRGLSAGAQPSWWDALPHVRPPLLLIAGAEDARYLEITARMQGLCPSARRVIVAHAGHNTHLEAPAAFSRELKPFLADLV